MLVNNLVLVISFSYGTCFSYLFVIIFYLSYLNVNFRELNWYELRSQFQWLFVNWFGTYEWRIILDVSLREHMREE